jgi:hypothetical protein
MTEKKYRTRWFVEPHGSHTNKIIAERLNALGEVGTEAQALGDNLGDDHSVFEVPSYMFISDLYKSQRESVLNFKVFSQAEGHGPIRQWIFGKQKKKIVTKSAVK